MDELGPQVEDAQQQPAGWGRVRELLMDVGGALATLGFLLWQAGWLPDVDVGALARQAAKEVPQVLARLVDAPCEQPRLAQLQGRVVVHTPLPPEPLAELPPAPRAHLRVLAPSRAQAAARAHVRSHPLSVAEAVRACEPELLAEATQAAVAAAVEGEGARALQRHHHELLAGLEGAARRDADDCLSAVRAAAARARRAAELLLERG